MENPELSVGMIEPQRAFHCLHCRCNYFHAACNSAIAEMKNGHGMHGLTLKYEELCYFFSSDSSRADRSFIRDFFVFLQDKSSSIFTKQLWESNISNA